MAAGAPCCWVFFVPEKLLLMLHHAKPRREPKTACTAPVLMLQGANAAVSIAQNIFAT